ncbi:GNAT family N-acetyltransferase [Halobacillus sp. B23F22_1]|uniref:GNAT family N-acetyltransferase n=1 Tax=Halobacillus sp. B23F22_1 TaxID=3459514 RepID=UPI00373E05D3
MAYMNPIYNRNDYLPLLLLADENDEIVSGYINEGEMYEIIDQDQLAGVCLFVFPQNNVVEIKNIAIYPEKQGKGLGRKVLLEAFTMFQKRELREIIVGTANSNLNNIAFYQKCGFRMNAIRKGFFSHYPEPIYENGIQALDMIVFSKHLR